MDYDMVHMVFYSESRDHLSRLKWFWHVPKMDSDSYTGQRILEIGLSRKRGRPQRRFVDLVKRLIFL